MNLLQRLISAALVTWLAVTLAFFALRILPGDAIQAQLAQASVDAETIQQRRAEQGLLDSPGIQYLRFIGGVLRGDLGYSLLSREPVSDMIWRNVPPTLALALSATIIASVVGIGLGVAGGLSARWGLSSVARLLIDLSLSTPIYYTSTLAIFLFSVQFGLLPSAGAGDINHLILPVAVLGFHSSGAIGRVTQANIRDSAGAEFIRTARAKGLTEGWVIRRHVLRVALLPVIQVIALQAGFLLSGTVITESIFVRPGIGRLLLTATIQQDYPVVQGIVILSGLIYTFLNTAADLLHSFVDPRIVYR